MNFEYSGIDKLPTPCYLIDFQKLIHNLEIAKKHCDTLNIKLLLAIKGFPLGNIFKDISTYLDGISASSLYEAKLGKNMKKEIHIHSTAYKDNEFNEISELCDYIVFNSLSQLERYKNRIPKTKKIGVRINPEYSEICVNKYNPCVEYSRLGMVKSNIRDKSIDSITGLHFHAMCENEAEIFAQLINKVTENFSEILEHLSWINFGGGQLIASPNYNNDCLKQPIANLTSKYGLSVYIEPCESIVADCGYLIATVLDIVNNKKSIAILDTSAPCHMPGVLEMPYMPDVIYPSNSKEGKFSYVLSGCSCLAGDIIGEYSFDSPLKTGDKIVFSEMGAYTFARENYFNGINFPTLILKKGSNYQVVKQFKYDDYEAMYF